MKHQIAALLATQSKTIKLSFIDVQKQSAGYDCGLLALAFATANSPLVFQLILLPQGGLPLRACG